MSTCLYKLLYNAKHHIKLKVTIFYNGISTSLAIPTLIRYPWDNYHQMASLHFSKWGCIYADN